jgi:E1A/CREB-binding protein
MQSKATTEKNQAISMNENTCQLCAVERLTFEPPPIYCTPCGSRIKCNAMYYTIRTGELRHYICIPCFNEARGETIEVEGYVVAKIMLEATEEWVMSLLSTKYYSMGYHTHIAAVVRLYLL